METRRDRFRRLANIRVNNALKQIELVGNLSNKSSYEYSENEIRAMFFEMEQALRANKARFQSNRNRKFKI